MNSKHKLIVISGANGYVGKALVKKLLEEGYSVACIVRTEIHNESPSSICRYYSCDLRSVEATENIIETIIKTQGSIFGCIHAAGGKPTRKDMISVTREDLQEQLIGTLMTGVTLLQTVAKYLKKQKEGVLIGITTSGVVIPSALKHLGSYGIAKMAFQGFLETMQDELKNSSVRVYSVAPGFMEGGMNKEMPRIFVDMIKHGSKSGSLATAEDVAEKISSLLIGDDNKMVTHLIAPEII